MKQLDDILRQNAAFKALLNGKGNIVVNDINDEALLISSAFLTLKKDIVVIKPNQYEANMLYQRIMSINDNDVLLFPVDESYRIEALAASPELLGQRLDTLYRLTTDKPKLVITHVQAIVRYLPDQQIFKENCLDLKVGMQIDIYDLQKYLLKAGYQSAIRVDQPFYFSKRGGVIDVFSIQYETPVRIELWDDEIDSIRSFDVESQRSIERLQKVTIYPATEYVLTQAEIDDGVAAINDEVAKQADIFKKSDKYEELSRLKAIPDNFNETTDIDKFVHSFVKDTVSLIEYFDRETTLFVLDEPNRIVERMELVEFEFTDSTKNRLEKGYIIPSQADMIFTCREIYAKVNCRRLLVVSTLEYKPKGLDIAEHFKVDSKSISSYNNRFEYLVADLKKYKKSGYRIVLISNSRTRAMRMVDDLRDNGIDSYFSEDYDKALVEGEIMVTYGNIHKGFEYPIVKFVVIAESDIFGQEKKDKKRRKKQYNGKAIADFNELAIGDYVVHENYGLGIYRGIEKIEVEGIERDYIKIEYSGTDTLYILATQLDVLQKYAGADARKPKLNKLNSQEWGKTKSKVKTAVEQVAKDLVELYAKRQNEQGFQFGEDTVWQREFEEMFPYEETSDQLAAIEDTKHDMQSTKIMDRLICGDVGYGKTEVAIRAAFKAVQDGKQVAYLVPTTILAQQHFNTFEQRMKDFPVKVAMLSRFRTPKEIKQTIADLRKGMVDIVIGTHRLLS